MSQGFESLQYILPLVSGVLGLYIVSLYLSSHPKKEFENMGYKTETKQMIALLILIMFIFLISSSIQVIRLLIYLYGYDMSNLKIPLLEIYYVILVAYLVIMAVFLFNQMKGLRPTNMVPKLNERVIILIVSFATIWLYLNEINSLFPETAYIVATAITSIFFVSVIMAVYLIYLLSKYLNLYVRKVIFENIDFRYHIFTLTLSMTFFSFAILSKQTQSCDEVVCQILLVAYGVTMNHAISELGRAIKKTIGRV